MANPAQNIVIAETTLNVILLTVHANAHQVSC
jgi:hypothetical protein